jgi:hypothetical protein
VYPDGRILAGGTDVLARLTSAGALDDTFAPVALPREAVVAPEGDGAVAVDFEDAVITSGLTVRHFAADGTPGAVIDVPFTPDDVYDATWYTAGDVAVDGAGRVLIAASRNLEGSVGPTHCRVISADPVLVNPDGTTQETQGGGEVADHFLFPAGGGVLVTGSTETGCIRNSPARSDQAFLQELDGNLGLLAVHSFLPELHPPGLTIEGPAPGTGTTAAFHFAVSGAGDLACGLDDAPLAPCPPDLTLANVALGPHTMHARAVGINGATRDAAWQWTVTAPAVATPTPTPSPSPSPAPTASAAPRKGGKVRLTVHAPAGTRVRISARVTIGGRARHRLKARSATVPAAGVLTRTLKLDRRARRLVRRAKKPARLRIRIAMTAPGGARTVRVRTVRLRR